MEQKKVYKVAARDTLESIAEKTGYTPEEIRQWNNNHSYHNIRKMFESYLLPLEIVLPDYPPKPKPKPKELTPEEKEKKLLEDLAQEKETKYRCEQSVISKINGIIQNYANTKSEFLVRKQQPEGRLIVKIEITDSITEVYPDNLAAAMQLLNDVEMIKCDVGILADAQTGKIARILNHRSIINRWEKHKVALQGKYGFVRSSQTREDLNKFISLAENQITNEQNLIQDLNIKVFFGLFFERYLVADNSMQDVSYATTFNSQLFENVRVPMQFTQKIISESEEKVSLNKTGVLDKKKYSSSAFERMYDAKFKPIVKYKFADFNMQYNENCTINTRKKCIETAEITIIEEVKNNVEINISCNIKKIKN